MKLYVDNLSKSFHQKEVLKEIDYTFTDNKIYALIGKNGAGKTTFFNCLNEDIKKDSGRLTLEYENTRIPLTSNDIGYVISTPIVPEFLTGREFIEFFMEVNKERLTNVKDIDYYFDLVKLSTFDQNKLLKDYSHGMKNKIQLLIIIIENPKVILLDEPLTSIDIVVQEDLKELFRKMKKDHIFIFSTHILDLALDLCDEVVILNNKKLELIEKKNLNTKKYKDKIIKELRDSNA